MFVYSEATTGATAAIFKSETTVDARKSLSVGQVARAVVVAVVVVVSMDPTVVAGIFGVDVEGFVASRL